MFESELIRHSEKLKRQSLITPERKSEDSKLENLILNARILRSHGENDLAFGLVTEALKVDSFSPKALRMLVEIAQDKNEDFLVIKACEALAEAEKSFIAYSMLGHAYYKVENDLMAAESYRKALSVQIPDSKLNFDIFKNLGNISVRSGDYDGAEEFYNKAYSLDPHSDPLLVNLGTLALQKSDFEDAKDRFRQALELNPKNDKAWVGLALVHNYFGDHVIAFANLENALDTNPKNKTAVQMVAQWGLRDQKIESAVERLQAYLGEVEFDKEISLVLIHLFCLSGQHAKAKIELERALLFEPDDKTLVEIEAELCKSVRT